MIAYSFRKYPGIIRIQTIYNFVLIYPWIWQFSSKVPYFLTVSIVFYVYKQAFTAQ